MFRDMRLWLVVAGACEGLFFVGCKSADFRRSGFLTTDLVLSRLGAWGSIFGAGFLMLFLSVESFKGFSTDFLSVLIGIGCFGVGVLLFGWVFSLGFVVETGLGLADFAALLLAGLGGVAAGAFAGAFVGFFSGGGE